jgi:transposase InsO family protein
MPGISSWKGGHPVQTTDAQVRKLMKEIRKSGYVGQSALRSGMSRNTAARYVKLGKLPSELKSPRTWRTRPDSFEEDWPGIAQRLRDAPELEAKALFEDLLERNPDRYHPGHLRTFQRRLKQWRASEGPERSVFFPQEHRPGEAFQTDFTWATKLGITIGGEPFVHMLCHVVLPYSNWEWVTVCRSESSAALKRGVQEAVFRLGKVPAYHQTDNSGAATHNLTSGKRIFNDEYLEFIRHLGMEPRTIAVGEKNQNGDVEALHGALKRRLTQHLILRVSNDFEVVEEYEAWLTQVMEKANRLRTRRLNEDLAVMKPVEAERVPEFTEIDIRVTARSTIHVKHNVYSVPSRLIGEMVRVRIYDDRVEVYYGGKHQLTVERLLGRGGHRINYRHIIWSLVRKPGAFRLFKYREDLFPTLTFRWAYDTLCKTEGDRRGSLEYLRILHLAASTTESEVEAALELVLEEGTLCRMEQIKALVDSSSSLEPPKMVPPLVDLSCYDALLCSPQEVA